MADLSLYEVTHRNFTTTMKLSEEDAESLGATKVGDVETAQPQPVTRPPYAVDEDGKPVTSEATSEKRLASARNKARSTSDSK